MKKCFAVLFLMLTLSAHCAVKIKVNALEDYSSVNPDEFLKVEVAKGNMIEDFPLIDGDIIHCKLEKIVNPKRAKRDAKIFFVITSYEDKKGLHKIQEKYLAKYQAKILSKEEIKKIPPKDIAKKTAGTVGSFFVQGFSQCVSFVDGAIENKENNRLKSGAKQVYDDSLLSYVKKGEEIVIKKGDTFYLNVKKIKD